MIGEAPGEPFHQAEPVFDLPQQDRTSIRCHPSSVESRDDFPAADLLKSERPLGTLCFHETASSVKCKCLLPTAFTSGRAVSCHRGGENCGLARRASEGRSSPSVPPSLARRASDGSDRYEKLQKLAS